MARTKQSRSRSPTISAPVIGAVGASLALAGGAHATGTAAPAPDTLLGNNVPGPQINLSEEEIADVNLGTFFVFDREDIEMMGVQFAQRGCRGCGRCAGAGRCAGGRCAVGGCRCGGCRGCAVGGCRSCIACAGCAGCSCGCCVSWGACRFIC
jgi:hypothetical protein